MEAGNDQTNQLSPETTEPSGASESLDPKRKSFFERVDWLSFACTVFVTLTVYLLTLAPEVTLEMSGMLSTAAMYGGVAHPPGFPLWTLYAWLFTEILPFSNIAWRVAVSCAVASSLTCGIIALIVSRGGVAIAEGIVGFDRLEPAKERWLRFMAGLVAGTTYGFNGVSWYIAVTVDTRAPGICLFSVVVCLLIRWAYAPENRRYLYAAFLVFGLTISANAMLTPAALAIPFFVMCFEAGIGRDLFLAASVLAGVFSSNGNYLSLLPPDDYSIKRLYFWIGALCSAMCLGLIIRTRRLLTASKPAFLAGMLSILGLMPFFYLPIASMTNPPSNWGYARTVEGFYHVLTRGQFERLNPTGSFSELVSQMGLYLRVAMTAVGVPCLLTALIPFFFLKRMRAKERGMMLGLAAFFLCTSVLMTILLNPPPTGAATGLLEQYFPPSYLILTIWTGFGLSLLGTFMARRKIPRVAVPEVVLQ